jgi:hypothetical protein
MPSASSNYSWITPSITHANAVIIVTPRLDTCLIWMDHAVGVWYDGTRWAIFNEDTSPMHVANAYNVLISPAARTLLTWRARRKGASRPRGSWNSFGQNLEIFGPAS